MAHVPRAPRGGGTGAPERRSAARRSLSAPSGRGIHGRVCALGGCLCRVHGSPSATNPGLRLCRLLSARGWSVIEVDAASALDRPRSRRALSSEVSLSGATSRPICPWWARAVRSSDPPRSTDGHRRERIVLARRRRHDARGEREEDRCAAAPEPSRVGIPAEAAGEPRARRGPRPGQRVGAPSRANEAAPDHDAATAQRHPPRREVPPKHLEPTHISRFFPKINKAKT